MTNPTNSGPPQTAADAPGSPASPESSSGPGPVPVDYASYLRLPELLDLQEPLTRPTEHDELLFIVVHQASELWLLQLLHELDKIRADLTGNHLFRVISGFRRSASILQVLREHIVVLTTMTPLSFSEFRDRLDTASGFQSMQFRELEHLLGLKNTEQFERFPKSLHGWDKAAQRLNELTVMDGFYRFLEHRGESIPDEALNRAPTESIRPHPDVQESIFQLYLKGGEYRILFELMIDFEEALQAWRYQHVKMTERTIGNKEGTAGSTGVDYLKASVYKQAFPDLWAIRHKF